MQPSLELPSLDLGLQRYSSFTSNSISPQLLADSDVEVEERRSHVRPRTHNDEDLLDLSRDQLSPTAPQRDAGSQFLRPPSATALDRGRNFFVLPHSRSSSVSRVRLWSSKSANVIEETAAPPEQSCMPSLEFRRSPTIRHVDDNRRYGICLTDPTRTLRAHGIVIPDMDPDPVLTVKHISQGGKQGQHKNRPRRTTQTAENAASDDPLSKYFIHDPNPFFASTQPGHDSVESRGSRTNNATKFKIQFIDAVCLIGSTNAVEKVGKCMTKGIEDLGNIAKDLPKAAKEAQVKLRIKRAKEKIGFLGKSGSLSG